VQSVGSGDWPGGMQEVGGAAERRWVWHETAPYCLARETFELDRLKVVGG
jgi:hypothetical protein